MFSIVVCTVFAFAAVHAKPECDIYTSIGYTLRDWTTEAWLEQSLSIWYASIGSRRMLNADTAAIVIDGDWPFVAVPSNWYYNHEDFTDSSIRAFASCSPKMLSNATLADIDRPVLTIKSVNELVGGPFHMCMKTKTIGLSEKLTMSTSMPESGYAVAKNCSMLECVFTGKMLSRTFTVVFSLERSGIGIDQDTYSRILYSGQNCSTLVIKPSLKIPVCIDKIVTRLEGQMSVKSVYRLDETQQQRIVVGIDPLLENDQLVFHFNNETDTTTVGIAWIGSRFWNASPLRVAFYIMVILITMNWPMVPMATSFQSSKRWYKLQTMNVVSAVFLAFSAVYFAIDGSLESTRKIAYESTVIAASVIILLLMAIMTHACIVIHAQLTMDAKSPRRILRVSLFYTALICETIVVASSGSTEHDIQAAYCVAAAIAWSFTTAMRLVQLNEYNPLFIVSIFAAFPAMIMSVSPSMGLLGIEHENIQGIIVCFACAFGGIFCALEPYYRNLIKTLGVEEEAV